VALEGWSGWLSHEIFFFWEDLRGTRRSFPPGLVLAGLDEEDEPSTHSRGEGLINLIRGFIGMIDGDSTGIVLMKGGSSE
jgi:hypothetical protein